MEIIVNKKTWIITGVVAAAVIGLISFAIVRNLNSHFTTDNHAQVFPASDANGNIAENIDGNPDAPVKIYEYGDYQCTGCAPLNPYINQLIEEYDGKVAVVFRTMIMSYHPNGTAAATAANAAAQQGYWKQYKDLLYTNQNEWYYSEPTVRQQQFERYFMKASDNKGDLEKFRADMSSAALRKKLRFDEDLAQIAKAEFTPTFFVEDEFVDQRSKEGEDPLTANQILDLLRAAIDKKLEAKGISTEKSKTDTDKSTKK